MRHRPLAPVSQPAFRVGDWGLASTNSFLQVVAQHPQARLRSDKLAAIDRFEPPGSFPFISRVRVPVCQAAQLSRHPAT
jgi:hypothetical protein